MTDDTGRPAGDASLARRWSERRARVAEAEAAEAPTLPREEDEREIIEREAREAENLAAAEAVDLEALDAASDMSVFWREGVPDLLRRRAMRALWRSDPVFANIDRLNDYDEDFRAAGLTPATLASAWQAGRGYLFPEKEEAQVEPEATAADAGELDTSEPGTSELEPGKVDTASTDTERLPAEREVAAEDLEGGNPKVGDAEGGDPMHDAAALGARSDTQERTATQEQAALAEPSHGSWDHSQQAQVRNAPSTPSLRRRLGL